MKTQLSNFAGLRRNRRGYTFIEVMMGSLIAGLSFLAIFGGMTMGFTVTQLTRENLRATQIMLDKMEGARLYSWAQLNDTNFLTPSFTNWFFETNGIGMANAQGNGIAYTGTVTVSAFPYSTSYQPEARLVVVTVGWTSGNVPRTRSMSTCVTMMGLQNYVYNH